MRGTVGGAQHGTGTHTYKPGMWSTSGSSPTSTTSTPQSAPSSHLGLYLLLCVLVVMGGVVGYHVYDITSGGPGLAVRLSKSPTDANTTIYAGADDGTL
jgi:hypothetical protein